MKVRKIDSAGLRSLGSAAPLKGIRARSEWVCPTGVDREALDEAGLESTCRSVTLAELDGAESDESVDEDVEVETLGALNQPTKISLRSLLRKGVELEGCVIEGRTMRCTLRGFEEVDDD